MIVSVRYDERLIHGQVAAFWVNQLNIDRIVVLDEKAREDEMLRMSLQMAVPKGVGLSIISDAKLIENMKINKYGNQRILVITRNLHIILNLVKSDIGVKELNLGNMSMKDGYTRINKNVCLSSDDANVVREIASQGVRVISQLTPSNVAEDCIALLDEKGL